MKPPNYSRMPSSWSPRMVTMTWKMLSKDALLTNTTALSVMMKSSSIKWEGLPGWQTLFEIESNLKSLELKLLLWPEPSSD